MRRALIIAMGSLAAVLASHAQAHDVATIEGWSGNGKPSWAEYERPMEVVTKQLRAFPETTGEGRPTISVTAEKNEKGDLQVDVIEDGLMDDAVAGTHHRYVMHEFVPNSFHLIAYGVRYKCRRGGDTETFTDKPCP